MKLTSLYERIPDVVEPVVDQVNHPPHYTTASGMECIDAIEAMISQPGWSASRGFYLGNVLKYIWRHVSKGGVESLKKARWYLDRCIADAERVR